VHQTLFKFSIIKREASFFDELKEIEDMSFVPVPAQADTRNRSIKKKLFNQFINNLY